jgi:predicted N-acyltransferase
VARPHASLHRWYDEEFETILRRWLPEANREQLAEIDAVNAELPFTASAPSLAEFKAESAA